MKLKCDCGKEWSDARKATSPDYVYSEECQTCKTVRLTRQFNELIPQVFANTDPLRLPQPQLNQALAWKYARGGRGLILTGETGRGKTRTIWLRLRKLIIDENFEPRNFTWFKDITFGQELGIRYRNNTAEEWLQGLTKVPLLFIDDIGKMKLTDRAESELFGLIDIRCENGKPTIFTTNEIGETMKEMMTDGRGAPLVRRLREFCEQIKF